MRHLMTNNKSMNKKNLKILINNVNWMWKRFFTSEVQDLKVKIEPYDDGTNPSSGIPQLIMFIYSMESWLPYLLNNSSRSFDKTRIHTLAPFAKALQLIQNSTESSYRKGDTFDCYTFTSLFRGFSLDDETISEYISLMK